MKFKLLVSSLNKALSSETSSNFHVNLAANFNDVTRLRLNNCVIPITYYPINSNNNIIYFNEDAGANATATITPGSYTPSALASHIGTIMTAASPNARTYTATYSTTLNAFVITVSAGTFRFRFASGTTSTARKVLGFTAVDGVLSASQTSPNQPQLNLTSVIYIRSRAIGSSMIRAGIVNGMYDNIVCSVPVNVALGDINAFQNPVEEWYEVDANNLQDFDLSLYDENGFLIDLRGCETFYEFDVIAKI